MRGLVIFIAVLAVMASFSFVAVGMNNKAQEAQNIKVEEKPRLAEFSTFTTAVCENKEDGVYCKDEFFVNCNGSVSKAVDAAECEGIKVEVPKALGFATFGSEWKDPRN